MFEAGLVQRITAINLFLYDIYHDQQVTKDGTILANYTNYTLYLGKNTSDLRCKFLHTKATGGILYLNLWNQKPYK